MRYRFVLTLAALVLVFAGPTCSGALAQQGAPEQRGWLGAQLQDLPKSTVKKLGLKHPHAILVELPVGGGPAERAGLQAADVILEMNGSPVRMVHALITAIQQRGPGNEVRLAVWRRGKRITVAAKLASLADAQRITGGAEFRAAEFERQIEASRTILAVFSRQRFPEVWARAQRNLGDAFAQRGHGNPADNLERAIAAMKAALSVRGGGGPRFERALTQWKLGSIYASRVHGDRAENLEDAVANFVTAQTVLSRKVEPLLWASIQMELGDAYAQRIRGEPAENHEKAVAALEAALTILSRETVPLLWVRAQDKLAEAYQTRVRGDLANNWEKVIAVYEATLAVYTRDGMPKQWANNQVNLANELSRIPRRLVGLSQAASAAGSSRAA